MAMGEGDRDDDLFELFEVPPYVVREVAGPLFLGRHYPLRLVSGRREPACRIAGVDHERGVITFSSEDGDE